MVSKHSALSMIKLVVEAATELQQLVTIKLHPADAENEISTIVRGRKNVSIEKERPAKELIVDSDICIVSSSTTGLEVCSMMKPLIYLDVNPNANFIPYEDFGAALIAHDRATLIASLRKYDQQTTRHIVQAGQKRLISEYLANMPSDTIEQIASTVYRKKND